MAILLTAAAFDGAAHVLMAQNLFGGASRATLEAQSSGIVGWLLTMQSEFFREMSSTIRAAKGDGSAAGSLLALSFLYGIFHAAGPGHGKAVIASYLVANGETARRGIILSFVSAFLQSLVAVLNVGVGAWLLNATARSMCGAERAIEIASYGFIAVFGARLAWTKGGAFIRTMRAWQVSGVTSGPPSAYASLEGYGGTGIGQMDAQFYSSAGISGRELYPKGKNQLPRGDQHLHDEHCGHSHSLKPSDLTGSRGWLRGISAVLTVGIRPCSGALLVLVFALAQGLFWVGIAATFAMGLGTATTVAAIAIIAVYAKNLAVRLMTRREMGAALISSSLEFVTAGFILLFGVGLLFGYAAAEHVTCF